MKKINEPNNVTELKEQAGWTNRDENTAVQHFQVLELPVVTHKVNSSTRTMCMFRTLDINKKSHIQKRKCIVPNKIEAAAADNLDALNIYQ